MSPIPPWLEIAAAAGEAVAGAAALFAVVYAIIEFRSWKSRRLAEARASVAARAMPVLVAFCGSVAHWMHMIALGASDARGLDGDEAIDRVASYCRRARTEVEIHQKEFARVAAEATALLDSDELTPLSVANDVYLTIGLKVRNDMQYAAVRARQEREAALSLDPTLNLSEQEAALRALPKLDLYAVVDVPLRELRQKLDGALADGRRILGAIARHEGFQVASSR